MRTTSVLPGFEILPGALATGPLIVMAGGAAGILSTSAQAGAKGEGSLCFMTSFNSVPFESVSRIALSARWREKAACVLDDSSGILAVGGLSDGQGAYRGRIALYRCTGGTLARSPEKTWDLPGLPVAAVVLPRSDRAAALCRGALGSGMALAVINVKADDAVEVHQSLDDEGLGAAVPYALAVTPDGAHLLALASGYSMDPPSGDAVSWLYTIRTSDFAPSGSPAAVPGSSGPLECPLTVRDDGTCWVTTRSLGTDQAYVSAFRITDDGARVESQAPITRVSSPVKISFEPGGTSLAVCIENRLEIWPGGRRGGASETYEAPCGAVEWTREGLFVGEAGIIHQIDPRSCTTIKLMKLDTGWVSDMIVVPPELVVKPDLDSDGLTTEQEISRHTSSASPDTDGDGIPDVSDPVPTECSPRLMLPDAVEFHEEASGQEVKGIKIAPAFSDGYLWKLDYDREKMPWLVIHPMSDEPPGVIYLGVNPGKRAPGKMSKGVVDFELYKNGSNKQAAGSPRQIEVRILPEQRSGVRRILWIRPQGSGDMSFRDEDDPYHFRALGDMLAGPPWHLTHREVIAPTLEDLDSYAVIVLGTAAAAQGALTRQSLVRYVVDGGALLLLGEYLASDSNPGIGDWLTPLGIQLHTDRKANITSSVDSRHPILRHVDSLVFLDGCDVTATDASSVLLRSGNEPNQAAVLATTYGRGRIAVLASATPLESDAMAKLSNRQFAGDLFQWLTEGGSKEQAQDMDSDGLPDALEDKNGNGLVDPGETDYLEPDSDSDGLPDGVEDANANGLLDDGETSPLNPDSDRDGVVDCADPMPLPPLDAPVVSRVSPAQAPAEGGPLVLVSGRNFLPDAAVWFGNRQAHKVRIMRNTDALVEIPPCEDVAGGDVAVRVVNSSTGQEGSLPKGFNYTPCSSVPAVLQTLQAFSAQKGVYEGAVSLSIEPPPGIMPSNIVVLLHAEPPEGFEWAEPAQSVTEGASRPVVCRHTKAGDLCIVMLGPKFGASPTTTLGPIQWKYVRPVDSPSDEVTLSIDEPRVLAPNGQPMNVEVKNAVLELKSIKTKETP